MLQWAQPERTADKNWQACESVEDGGSVEKVRVGKRVWEHIVGNGELLVHVGLGAHG